MNLIIKTTLLYLLVAMLVFSIGGVVTYNMVQKEVKKETDYDLRYNYKQIVKAIEAGAPIELLKDDRVNITTLPYHPKICKGFLRIHWLRILTWIVWKTSACSLAWKK